MSMSLRPPMAALSHLVVYCWIQSVFFVELIISSFPSMLSPAEL